MERGLLSNREAQVLSLAVEGHIDESIAQQLDISVATVRGYWLRIRSKLGSGSRSELVAAWVQQNGREERDKERERHRGELSGSQAYDDQALERERAAMDKIMGSLTKEQKAAVASYRKQSDSERKESRTESEPASGED